MAVCALALAFGLRLGWMGGGRSSLPVPLGLAAYRRLAWGLGGLGYFLVRLRRGVAGQFKYPIGL